MKYQLVEFDSYGGPPLSKKDVLGSAVWKRLKKHRYSCQRRNCRVLLSCCSCSITQNGLTFWYRVLTNPGCPGILTIKRMWFVCLGFNGTFSTNRLYRAETVGKYVTYGQETKQIHNKTMKQYNKPRKSCALFSLGFLETIPSPRLGFLSGVFLANHLA